MGRSTKKLHLQLIEDEHMIYAHIVPTQSADYLARLGYTRAKAL